MRSSASALALRLSGGGTVSFSSKQVSSFRKRVNAHWHKWRSLRAGAIRVSMGGVTLNIDGLGSTSPTTRATAR